MSLCVVTYSTAHSVRLYLITYSKPQYIGYSMFHIKLKIQEYVHFSFFKFIRNAYIKIKELEPYIFKELIFCWIISSQAYISSFSDDEKWIKGKIG